MKQHLYTKLLILYFVLGGICFLLLSSGGSYLVEKRLERSTGESLYRAASQMVRSAGLCRKGFSCNPEV